jgi:hypothetical protein
MNSDDRRPMRLKMVSNDLLTEIKDSTYERIKNLQISVDEQGVNKEKTTERMKIFLKFLLHKNIRAAVKSWKEKTFGVKCDPRMALIIAD